LHHPLWLAHLLAQLPSSQPALLLQRPWRSPRLDHLQEAEEEGQRLLPRRCALVAPREQQQQQGLQACAAMSVSQAT